MNDLPVLITSTDHHFTRTPRGVWTKMAFAYDYWAEMLRCFSRVVVVARVDVRNDNASLGAWFRSDGPNVEFFDLPDWRGSQAIWALPRILWRLARAASFEGGFLLRGGCISSLLSIFLRANGRGFGFEVPGDVLESARHFSGRMPRPLLVGTSWVSWLHWRRLAKLSDAVHYVSEDCRRRYPARRRECEFVYSNVRLAPDRMLDKPRSVTTFSTPNLAIGSVGRLESEKGYDVILSALQICRARGLENWTFDVAGDGAQKANLVEQAESLGLGDRVRLVGLLPHGPAFEDFLDRTQLFLLASRSEGMPRSVLEAMSRGCPVLATAVGGLCEVVAPDCLVPADSPEALAAAICRVARSPEVLARMSARNVDFAWTLTRDKILTVFDAFMQRLNASGAS